MIKNVLASVAKDSIFLGCLMAVAILAAVVIATPIHAQEDSKTPAAGAIQKPLSVPEHSEGKIGIATYYHNRYSGRKTSSGAIYNPKKMTAAHPFLPLGTRVKVTNLANNRSVVVTVNDRCPKRNFELIDLSRSAAHKLGFLRAGKTQVCMVTLEEE
jgi:rare lipoprotein A